jgi:hypothetical protein
MSSGNKHDNDGGPVLNTAAMEAAIAVLERSAAYEYMDRTETEQVLLADGLEVMDGEGGIVVYRAKDETGNGLGWAEEGVWFVVYPCGKEDGPFLSEEAADRAAGIIPEFA